MEPIREWFEEVIDRFGKKKIMRMHEFKNGAVKGRIEGELQPVIAIDKKVAPTPSRYKTREAHDDKRGHVNEKIEKIKADVKKLRVAAKKDII